MPAGPQAPTYSLRRRLTLSILGASMLVWLVSLAIIVHVAWRETSAVFDDALKEGARLALVLGTSLHDQGALPHPEASDTLEPAKLKLYYQIVGLDGRVLSRADEAPQQPFTRELARDRDYLNVWVDREPWRIYVLRAQGFQVQIGQPWDERLEVLDEMAESLAWPALLLLALLGAFCWFLIRRLLQPIEQTAERIAAKSPDDLQPVPSTDEPRELQPILQAFNLVLTRLDGALTAERRFTADAAHELRTPLAALRMRIQLMQRQAQKEAGLRTDLQPLRDEVDRCTALVESLLALARLDPQQAEVLVKEAVDLPELFKRLAPSAAQSRHTAWHAHAEVQTMAAHPALLHSALRNLVDNAVRYSPPGSEVRLEATRVGEHVCIAVRDNGPGVADAERARLAERFFRVLGTGEPGSGLGLSIVARIVALHGGTLRFDTGLEGRGLAVLMDFPAGKP